MIFLKIIIHTHKGSKYYWREMTNFTHKLLLPYSGPHAFFIEITPLDAITQLDQMSFHWINSRCERSWSVYTRVIESNIVKLKLHLFNKWPHIFSSSSVHELMNLAYRAINKLS